MHGVGVGQNPASQIIALMLKRLTVELRTPQGRCQYTPPGPLTRVGFLSIIDTIP